MIIFINWIKENVLNIIGISIPSSFSIYTLIDKLTPIFAILGLISSIIVAITAIVVNIDKHRINKQVLDDCVDKHKNRKK